MKDISIKELYAGKLDAKDEYNYDGAENFIKTYVVAEHFNIDRLIKGDYCYITGFKGTGKTALLFYLNDKFREIDTQTCSSYILFKEDYTTVEREEIEKLSRRSFSNISVDTDSLKGSHDFEYIWRWIILKRIISDNEEFNRNIFEDDKEFDLFERMVNRIQTPRNSRRVRLFDKIKLSVPVKDSMSSAEISPTIAVDFSKPQDESYYDFVDIINESERLLSKLTKTDIPYYIFIDELEAYSGNESVFLRDLCLIRDLVITVKHFNTIFVKNGFRNIKIICSVRSEIINAIERNIITKEINKVISAFSLPLNWNYPNSNSYAHPIIEVLLKRISVCSEAEDVPRLELYRKWFPEKIHRKEPASYILNNTWYKPRDIIRLIITAQNSLYNYSKCFNTAVFDSITKQYSIDSLEEIREELRALYTPNEIDSIISCFTGFKTVFTVAELQNHINSFYTGTIIHRRFNSVLYDLYRLGVIGNYYPKAKAYRWQHRGDQTLILDDEWSICIHSALRSALSLSKKIDYNSTHYGKPRIGDTYLAVIDFVNKQNVEVTFGGDNTPYRSTIGIRSFSQILKRKISDLREVVFKGNTMDVQVTRIRGDHYDLKLLNVYIK